MENFYEILKIPNYSNKEEIKKAYRIHIKNAHPDKGGNLTEFENIKNAFDFLANEENKQSYDVSLQCILRLCR